MDQRVVTTIPGAAFDIKRRREKSVVRIVGFGPFYRSQEKEDWSFRHVQKQEDGKAASKSSLRHLPYIANKLGVKELFVPSPAEFNGKICTPGDLGISITIKDYDGEKVVLKRGYNADGILLEEGEALGISLGGCPLVVLQDPETGLVGVAHAGRGSLIDEGRLQGKPAREHESVVNALVSAMIEKTGSDNVRGYKCTIVCPISAKELNYPWDHPTYGAFNRIRSEYCVSTWGAECIPEWKDPSKRPLGHLDLREIIRRQLMFSGIPDYNTATIWSPSDWYTTRGPKEDQEKRNLVMVKRLKMS